MAGPLLNGRESMKARELLSWNIHDLSHQTSIPPDVITDFERGKHQLLRHQNIQVRDVYEAQGIEFGEHMEVSLKKKKSNAAMERMRHIDKQRQTKTQSQLVLEKLLQKTNSPPKL